MSRERIQITRPGTFSECNSCKILSDQIENAKEITTHVKLNCPLTVREIHIKCSETGSRSEGTKGEKVNFVPNVFMDTHVEGAVHFNESAQSMGFVDNSKSVKCPHYHPGRIKSLFLSLFPKTKSI
jgi:hypothetical protein